MIKKVINLITGLFKFSWLKKIKFEWSWFKKLFGWIKSILKETLAQTFTLLGFFYCLVDPYWNSQGHCWDCYNNFDKSLVINHRL